MVNLHSRSSQKELLDADDISFAEIQVCMGELNTINSLLGGHLITIQGLKEFLAKKETFLNVCEIGCGGGDNLQAIAKAFRRTKIRLSFTGIDLKKECIEFAARQYPALPARWITTDYREANLTPGKPDVIFSSLFCHHFTDSQLVEMLQWMDRNSARGFFINDLQRSAMAYYLIKWLTAAFSRSYLVKNDAALSVARSFQRKDWEIILARAGIKKYTIRWKWAFRYLIVCKK